MSVLVECVPNFSEGRDRKVIDAIADAAKSVPGVVLLDVDPGAATNRTVYTFAGAPEDVLEAAFQAIRKGVELISSTRCAELKERFGPMIQAIVEAHVRQRDANGPCSQSEEVFRLRA